MALDRLTPELPKNPGSFRASRDRDCARAPVTILRTWTASTRSKPSSSFSAPGTECPTMRRGPRGRRTEERTDNGPPRAGRRYYERLMQSGAVIDDRFELER